jgi:hypothetical protein
VEEGIMLPKIRIKTQNTLLDAVASPIHSAERTKVGEKESSVVLRPLQRGSADQVRQQLAQREIVHQDVDAAIKWARKIPKP